MVDRTDLAINVAAILVVVGFAFGLSYHPYYFGDELILHRLAIVHDYAFWPIFRDFNAYKPRLVGNGITAALAAWEMPRWVLAVLQVACAAWIGALLYVIVRYLLNGGRVLAWLLIATVVTSRFGIVFYFDYSSGLLDLLATALLLCALAAAWMAWREELDARYAVMALATAVLCIFVHERYVAGLLAAGIAIAIAECAGSSARRRMLVVGWALSLGLVPLLLFWVSKVAYQSLPMGTGTAGQEVSLDLDTVSTALAYGYNVFLGGNYGQIWYWGNYNHQQPIGQIAALTAAVCTLALVVLIILRRRVAWNDRWLATSLLFVAVAMIGVASLPGSAFLQPRWMFPVALLAAIAWIVIVKGVWRYVAIGLILAVNITYLVLATHDSMSQVAASRSANSLAVTLLELLPRGGSAIVVGGPSDKWTVGGGDAVDMGPRAGDTFSRINFRMVPLYVDPFISGRAIDPANYNLGVVGDGVTANQTTRYRPVTVNEALTLALASTSDQGRMSINFDPNAPGSTIVRVVEFYNPSLDHYFITSNAREVAMLDSGKTPGWIRTQLSFPVYAAAAAGTSPVCRFKIPPEVGDSHFFGRGPIECSNTGHDNPSFVNEGVVFHVALPSAGVCPAGTREVYRVFTNRADINHRYTIDRVIRDRMVASGWVAEGDGPNAVVMCVPGGGSS